MSKDSINREIKAKQDIGWDSLIQDAKEQITAAKARIHKLTDCIAFFEAQRDAKSPTRD
jgi:hypothetical protein